MNQTTGFHRRLPNTPVLGAITSGPGLQEFASGDLLRVDSDMTRSGSRRQNAVSTLRTGTLHNTVRNR